MIQLAEIVGNDAHLTVAGGVTTINDVIQIDKLGVDAQVGMALYTGKLGIFKYHLVFFFNEPFHTHPIIHIGNVPVTGDIYLLKYVYLFLPSLL